MKIFDEKIKQLIDEKKQIENKKNELSNSSNIKLKAILELKKITSSKKLHFGYDKEKVSYLLNTIKEFHQSEEFNKKLKDFLEILLIREKLKIELPFESVIENFIVELEERLIQIEIELNKKIEETKIIDTKDLDIDIKSLEELNNILNSEEKGYINEQMLSTLLKYFDIINLTNITKEEANEIIELLYQIKNLKIENKQEKNKVATKEDVIELIDKYIKGRNNKNIKSIIDPIKEKTDTDEDINQKEIQKEEILENIDLENAEEILKYFTEKNILEKFSATAIIGIITYSTKETVSKVYSRIMEELKNIPDKDKSKYLNMFFKDTMKSVWVKSIKEKKELQDNFTVKRHRSNNKIEVKTIGEECLEGNSLEDIFETKKILEKYQDFFEAKYRNERYGEALQILSSNPKIVEKNIKLCMIFKLHEFNKIPYSCILRNSIEEKIHMAIEIGLLKPPMNDEFKMMEELINKNEKFQENKLAEGKQNQSIRQYYQRALSLLPLTTIFDFAAFSKKINDEGFLEFYNYFFSNKIAGTADRKKIIEDNKNINESIFDEFEQNINIQYEEIIKNDKTFYTYDKENLFNEPLIKFIEENYTIVDKMQINNKTEEIKNEYVYYIGKQIISRQKLLNNAQKLLNHFKKLDSDMILYSITRNSLIPKSKFEEIKQIIKQSERSIQNGLSKTI